MSDIIKNAKIIANYLGWEYIPFNDLQGLPKAGWYETKPVVANPQKMILPDGKEVTIDFSEIPFTKNGWKRYGLKRYRYVCRTHGDLRFYNSFDALLPVISKLEKEDLKDFCYSWYYGEEKYYNFQKISFTLCDGGCYSEVEWDLDPPSTINNSFDEKLSWVQNTFNCVAETIEYVKRIKTKIEDGSE